VNANDRITKGPLGVTCTNGQTRVLPDKYRFTVDHWWDATNTADICFRWPPLAGDHVACFANVAAEELALHTEPIS